MSWHSRDFITTALYDGMCDLAAAVDRILAASDGASGDVDPALVRLYRTVRAAREDAVAMCQEIEQPEE
ncbi:hypothetical protein JJL56_01560 [Azospirillum sp. YIM DDC1]|uniref:Uncharacterized protein n=1 Tax=Azospirillum aestuarii TaxID=2802052 RepID=A0ABS1HRX2_9PROT|nr:hypothetical protein [Azospirillum aestuarii]MBK4717549.1 hypothetical protein [Azospirillum aestuarii]